MAKRFFRRNGQYKEGNGHYWTWKMIHVLTVINRLTDREQKPWSAKHVSEVTEISYKGVRDILKRLEERGFAVYENDVFGRKAWKITAAGSHALTDILDRRVQKEQLRKVDIAALPNFVKEVPGVIKRLRDMGWRDTDARTAVYKIPMGRILATLRFCHTRRHKIHNMGAYVRTILLRRHSLQWRLEQYAETFPMHPDIVPMLAQKAKLMKHPFQTFQVIAETAIERGLQSSYGGFCDIAFELQQAGRIKTDRRAVKKYQQGDYVYAYNGPRRAVNT